MAALGALAENQRRNERVDRGVVTVPSSGTAYVTIDPRTNSSITYFLLNPAGEIGSMRFMTHFQVCLDTSGNAVATTACGCSGKIKSMSQTINSVVYAPGTVLQINTYNDTAGAATTAINVRFTIWGMLQPGSF